MSKILSPHWSPARIAPNAWVIWLFSVDMLVTLLERLRAALVIWSLRGFSVGSQRQQPLGSNMSSLLFSHNQKEILITRSAAPPISYDTSVFKFRPLPCCPHSIKNLEEAEVGKHFYEVFPHEEVLEYFLCWNKKVKAKTFKLLLLQLFSGSLLFIWKRHRNKLSLTSWHALCISF